MTELEMSLMLNLVLEPVENKVKVSPSIVSDVIYMQSIFEISKKQIRDIGRFNHILPIPFISDN